LTLLFSNRSNRQRRTAKVFPNSLSSSFGNRRSVGSDITGFMEGIYRSFWNQQQSKPAQPIENTMFQIVRRISKNQ
jgi:hypothetical protein